MPRLFSSPMRRFTALSLLALPAIGVFAACSSNDQPDDPANTGGNAGDSSVPAPGGSDANGSGGSAQLAPCEFGNDASKCEAKDEFACTPFLQETGDECSRDSECESGALCFSSPGDSSSEGECFFVVGECEEVDSAVDGLRFGDDCDLKKDKCAGRCVAVGEDATEDAAECEETCRVGAKSGCGEDTLKGSGVSCAYFAFDLSDIDVTQGRGDVGICAPLCDCNDDCPGSQLCFDQPTDGYAGICTGGIASDDSLACDVGIGGAGGAP